MWHASFRSGRRLPPHAQQKSDDFGAFWVQAPPCEVIRFLPISRLLQIACGAALGRFYCWKQLYVREPDAPLRMPLRRGADEAATATEGQREHRDESGESCDRGV